MGNFNLGEAAKAAAEKAKETLSKGAESVKELKRQVDLPTSSMKNKNTYL